MTFGVERSGNVFRLKGELDIASEQMLMDALEPELDTGGEITLDLSELAFIDSSGVRSLIRAAARVGEGTLRLLDPVPPVRRVFELMRVDTVPNVLIEDGK